MEENLEEKGVDEILDFAIEYNSSGQYPQGLTANKKRAVRKRATGITVKQGEIFLQKKKGKVDVREIYHIIVKRDYKNHACCNNNVSLLKG